MLSIDGIKMIISYPTVTNTKRSQVRCDKKVQISPSISILAANFVFVVS